MRGAYGYSYPPGYYDFRYEADDNPAPSENDPVYVSPPPEMMVTVDSPTADDKNNTEVEADASMMDRRSDIPGPVLDDEQERIRNLEQRSFGFKVTVYRTPGNQG